jgi:hypothetical protein
MLPELKTLKIGEPAQRALLAAGIVSLEQLCQFSISELLLLHGIGPKAIGILQTVLKNEGLTFKVDNNE